MDLRIIKYYDRINRQYIDLEVTDEVARFLMSNDKKLRRHQAKYDYFNISIDTPINSNDEDSITLAETLEDKTEVMDCATCRRKIHLFNTVWKVVDKLNPKQIELIDNLYIFDKTQKEIAKMWNVSESSVSQMKDTALLHLTYHFYTDKEFKKTDLYKRNKREFEFDLPRVAKELDKENGLTFDLNAINNLVKDNTQMLKTFTSLGLEVNENEKQLLSYMNKTVKHFLETLNLDNSKQNTITIPSNLKLPEDFNIADIINKFLKN